MSYFALYLTITYLPITYLPILPACHHKDWNIRLKLDLSHSLSPLHYILTILTIKINIAVQETFPCMCPKLSKKCV